MDYGSLGALYQKCREGRKKNDQTEQWRNRGIQVLVYEKNVFSEVCKDDRCKGQKNEPQVS